MDSALDDAQLAVRCNDVEAVTLLGYSGRREAKRGSAEAADESGASAEAGRETGPSVLEAERADALASVAQAYLQHDEPRTLGSGYELVLLTTPDQLQHGPVDRYPRWDGSAMDLEYVINSAFAAHGG